MDIFFTHFYGRMSDVYGIAACGVYAEKILPEEEQYALDNGWAKLEGLEYKNIWYQGRQTRIKTSELKYNKKTRKMIRPCEGIESKVKRLEDCNIEEIREVYSTYIKTKSDQYKKSKDTFSDFYTSDGAYFDDQLIDPEFKRVIEYREDGRLHAFVICRLYEQANAMSSIQFCWDYHKPEIFLGKYSSIKEIEVCKNLGIDYLYLGGGYENMCIYKSMYQGFEWWTGSEWSKDKLAYKTLCESDTKTKNIYDLAQIEEKHTRKIFFSPSEISDRDDR